MTDMRHMEFIDRVAAADCETLRRKEATYRGSWKRRGGVGAFMMLARKWDRLEGILSQDLLKYDVFEAVENDRSGSDGTALAEIRDLRQYLLLVEAEMLARGAVVAESAPARVYNVRCETTDGLLTGTTNLKVLRAENEDDGSITVVVDHWPPAPAGIPVATARQIADAANPELRRVPWFVRGRGYFERKDIPGDLTAAFWSQRGLDCFVLEPHVLSPRIPRMLRDFYNMRGDGWTLRIDRCPPDTRDMFPRLPSELNMKEHEECPEWQRVLYTWDETGTKFRLAENCAAWHVEVEQ